MDKTKGTAGKRPGGQNAEPAVKAPAKTILFDFENHGRINWRLLWLLAAIVAFVAALVNGAGIWNGFVLSDQENLNQVLNVQEIDQFWTRLWANAVYTPLSQQWVKATYAWDSQSFGASPAGYHLVNVLLQAFACVYFYLFVFHL